MAFAILPTGHAPCATHFQTLQDASGPSSFAPGTALAGTWGLLGSEGQLPNIPSAGEAALCPLPTFPHVQQHLPASSWQRDPPRAGVEHLPRAGDSPACPLPCSMGMETLTGISSPLFSAVTPPGQTQHRPCPPALGWGNCPTSGHLPTPDMPCRASRCSGCKSQDLQSPLGMG